MQSISKQDYPYLYETHCHTSWCSACAVSSPQEMAAAYYAHGYAGIIITDHFLLGNSAVDRALPWDVKMHAYYDAYLAARDWAQGRDFDVHFGLEHQYGGGKEVLTYGIDLDFLLDHPELHRMPLGEYAALVHEAGGFLSMAHPYRDRGYIDRRAQPQPEYLDAVEVYNYHNDVGENRQAEELAQRTGLPGTAGGDVHEADSPAIGQAGVALRERAATGQELVAALRSGDFAILVGGELRPCRF